MSDLFLFTVASHNGDPNLQFLNILVNKGDVYHQGNLQKIFYNLEHTLSNNNAYMGESFQDYSLIQDFKADFLSIESQPQNSELGIS